MKAFLKAGILTEAGLLEDGTAGTPQGGILSPLLANVAWSVLDEQMLLAEFEAAFYATTRTDQLLVEIQLPEPPSEPVRFRRQL